MIREGGIKDTRIYGLLSIFIILVVLFAVFFSSTDIEQAFIPQQFLGQEWVEDLTARKSESRLFGLEHVVSLSYEKGGMYPSYLTITTIKTIIMFDEQTLLQKTNEIIQNLQTHDFQVAPLPEKSDQRGLKHGHRTHYMIYNGTDTSKNPSEMVKIIGEMWNCKKSGTSIICIGISQITEYGNNNVTKNYENWQNIIRDSTGSIGDKNSEGENGLIDNIKCH